MPWNDLNLKNQLPKALWTDSLGLLGAAYQIQIALLSWLKLAAPVIEAISDRHQKINGVYYENDTI